jgi:hypothetical protein
MPFTKKPTFEQFRHTLIASGKPIPEKEIVPIQAAMVALLDSIPDLLVQKTRRQGHKDTLIEVSSSWVGLDADHRTTVATFKKHWPGSVFEGAEELWTIERHEESVVLQFAAQYPNDRYLTGKVLVTF